MNIYIYIYIYTHTHTHIYFSHPDKSDQVASETNSDKQITMSTYCVLESLLQWWEIEFKTQWSLLISE